ncbi:cardiolipin synthase [Williamsoniiplasma lucivorax]|uniref:Cardiolipin synthase n=1 Tax=Williamsoniiplasma lucivorax TaxID=209274 RepID=A0A2S5RFF2_9MOLU|nr:cardiolipin synthase [Williamsoniiplasma lucivorax]PPE06041.1 cardiolipin synthetase [Williamsoniiplasma lucivorax]
MKKSLVAFGSLIFMFSSLIIFIVTLTIFLSVQMLWILFVLEIISIIWSFVVLMNQKRRIETRLRWALFITFVPVIGIGSYVFFGRVYKYKSAGEYKYKNFADFKPTSKELIKNEIIDPIIEKETPQFKRAFMMPLNQQNEVIYKNSNSTFFGNGAQVWPQIFKDISQAQEYILINMYIIADGELLKNLINLLKVKRDEGVNVYIIYDFIGSYTRFSNKSIQELKNMGVNIIPFSLVRFPFVKWTANYRDHRKDFSIDGKIGYVGGANIADEYINKSEQFGYWNDAMVRIVGEGVQGIEKVFVSDWMFITKKSIIEIEPNIGKKRIAKINESNNLAQIVTTGPNHDSPMHFDLLLNLIQSAQKRIWLSTPYFVPPIEMIKAIASAAKSGIDVRLVLPGISDKKFLLDISRKWTDDLFKAGVKIYSMNNVFNHTKGFLFDDEITFVGSTNLDYRAFFSDQQTMALIKSREFSNQIKTKFEKDFELSELYIEQPSKKWNRFYKAWIMTLNVIEPLL